MHWQTLQKPQEKGNRGYILQQIVELKRLQLSEGNSNNDQMHGQNNNVSSMRQFVKKYKDGQELQDSFGPDHEAEPNTSISGPTQDLKHEDGIEESFPFPFSQLGNPINNEPLWQNSQVFHIFAGRILVSCRSFNNRITVIVSCFIYYLNVLKI